MIQTTIEARQAALAKFIPTPELRENSERILAAIEDGAFHHRYNDPGTPGYASRDELCQLMLSWIEASEGER